MDRLSVQRQRICSCNWLQLPVATAKSLSPIHLKDTHHRFSIKGRSDKLVPTKVWYGTNVRSYYLQLPNLGSLAPAPIISRSEFVPTSLLAHLMRNKKDRAIGVKFEEGNNPPDAITNMEGALHTYITPIVLATIHGDYTYHGGRHMMLHFPRLNGKFDQARQVIVSALVQPDFEDDQVMLRLAALTDVPILGVPLPVEFKLLSVQDKQNETYRNAYDFMLRSHMIHYLVASHVLPRMLDVHDQARTIDEATEALERWILNPAAKPEEIQDEFVHLHSGEILSLELLYNSAMHQLQNELSVLESYFSQGYVYTFDPPAIFARRLDATLLNRLWIAALKTLASNNVLANMRVVAFNDYADPLVCKKLVPLALASQKHVTVLQKSALFIGPGAGYVPPKGAVGAMLVIHNNSDGFGQNIETEAPGGSMDGAIGAFSSTAASLRRDRADLLNHLM